MSIVPHGETCAAFCFLAFCLMLPSVFRLLRLHRHLIVALHGHQLMQAVAFLAVIVLALVFLGYERLNLGNDILALRKLLGCAQLVKLALGMAHTGHFALDEWNEFCKPYDFWPYLTINTRRFQVIVWCLLYMLFCIALTAIARRSRD